MNTDSKETEKQCDIRVVSTRTFRMSGMHNGEKFVKEIKAKRYYFAAYSSGLSL